MHISVIVPVYNVEKQIIKCLESLAKQTLQEIEVILVDDRGSDRSMNLIEDFVSSYKGIIQFIIVRHAKNRGLSAARNTGIDHASSEWVYFLDSDDWIEPNCLELLYSKIDNEVNFIEANFNFLVNNQIDNSYRFNFSDTNNLTRTQYVKMLSSKKIQCNVFNILARKKWIKTNKLYFKEGLFCEDILWTFIISGHLTKAKLISNRTYNYVYNTNSIMGKAESHKKDINLKVYNDQVQITNFMLDYITHDEHYQHEEIISYYKKLRYHYIFDTIRSLKINKRLKYELLIPLIKPIGFNKYNRLPLRDFLFFTSRYLFMKLFLFFK